MGGGDLQGREGTGEKEIVEILLVLLLYLKLVLNKCAHVSSLTMGHMCAGKMDTHILAHVTFYVQRVHDQANPEDTARKSDASRWRPSPWSGRQQLGEEAGLHMALQGRALPSGTLEGQEQTQRASETHTLLGT